MRSHRITGTAGVAAALVALAACSTHGPAANTANQKESASQLNVYNASQPVPEFNKSQLRQTLIDIETAQAQPTPTTTFFFNQGSTAPISSCPSIGFPVATTDEITNPDQLTYTGGNNSVSGTLPQIDPNGIYGGDSTGTYVLCLNNTGQSYASYWEGFVYSVNGSASWDTKTDSITNVTNPTGSFSVLKPSEVHKVANTTPEK